LNEIIESASVNANVACAMEIRLEIGFRLSQTNPCNWGDAIVFVQGQSQ